MAAVNDRRLEYYAVPGPGGAGGRRGHHPHPHPHRRARQLQCAETIRQRASSSLPPGSPNCAPNGPIAAPPLPVPARLGALRICRCSGTVFELSSVSLVSAAACFQFNTRHPTTLHSSLLCADELHECSFQEPSRFETKKLVQQPIALASGHLDAFAAPELALPAALQHQHKQPAPARPAAVQHEPEPTSRPPAFVHVRAPGRPPAWTAGSGPSQQPAAAHQHWRRAWLSSPAWTAHGLPTTGRASGLSSSAGLRRRSTARPAALRPASASQPATAVQARWRHGRGRRRGALQGTADCGHRLCESTSFPQPCMRACVRHSC